MTTENHDDALVEAVARALFEADRGGDPEWDYSDEARAAIAAIRAFEKGEG